MIKKAALTLFVIATFIIYSFHQRNESNQALSKITGNPAVNSQPNSTEERMSPDPSSPAPQNSVMEPLNSSGSYKDGTYIGKNSDAYYGYIQVKATISSGKLTSVDFLDYPQDRRNSIAINRYAMPLLEEQALQAQSAKLDGVSGATDTSIAFIESLSDALTQAE